MDELLAHRERLEEQLNAVRARMRQDMGRDRGSWFFLQKERERLTRRLQDVTVLLGERQRELPAAP